MAFRLDDLIPSIEKFLEGWKIVRVCPDKIVAPAGQLSFNVLALLVSLLLFMLARGTIAGNDIDEVGANLAATVISGFIAFVTGYVQLIWDSGDQALDRAKKWGMFFVYLWITSLLVVIVIDGIPIWNHVTPLTTIIINAIFNQGSLSALEKNGLRGIVIGLIALSIMLVKTRCMDKDFKINDVCIWLTLAAGLIVNAILLLMFLYGHVV
jgi:hypothetical protein